MEITESNVLFSFLLYKFSKSKFRCYRLFATVPTVVRFLLYTGGFKSAKVGQIIATKRGPQHIKKLPSFYVFCSFFNNASFLYIVTLYFPSFFFNLFRFLTNFCVAKGPFYFARDEKSVRLIYLKLLL